MKLFPQQTSLGGSELGGKPEELSATTRNVFQLRLTSEFRLRVSSHCLTFSVTLCTAFNAPNQWHVYDSIGGADNYLMIDLAADEIRDVNAANVQISAALNKLDLDGVDWDQRSKLNLNLNL